MTANTQDTGHRATQTDVYERVGKLETRFDGLEAGMQRIEAGMNRPYAGPTWVQIASLMLAGAVALASLTGVFLNTIVSPVATDAQLSLSSVVNLSRDAGRTEQQVATLGGEVGQTFDLIKAWRETTSANASRLSNLEGKMDVYERLEDQRGTLLPGRER